MKTNILTHGIISGIIVATLMLLSMNYFSYCEGNVDMGTSMLIGYASMLMAFSLVFVGIRNYRDKYNGGMVSFGKAFKIGILIALISSTVYVIAWLIYYYNFSSNFMEKYAAHQLEELKTGGASKTEIAKQIKDSADFAVSYKNPFFNAAMTYLEIFPVGLIVTLISSLILKRKSTH